MPKTIGLLIDLDVSQDAYGFIKDALTHAGHQLLHLCPHPQAQLYGISLHSLDLKHIHQLDGLILFPMPQSTLVSQFIQQYANRYKPIFSLSGATILFIAAQIAYGRRLTAEPHHRPLLQAAQAVYLDQAVVNDHNLYISQQSPAALAEFLDEVLRVLALP